MCDWVTLLYSRKWTEHCKPAIMEKTKNYKIFFGGTQLHVGSQFLDQGLNLGHSSGSAKS